MTRQNAVSKSPVPISRSFEMSSQLRKVNKLDPQVTIRNIFAFQTLSRELREEVR